MSQINLDTATTLTHEFQTNNPNATKAYYVSKTELLSILNQSHCEGIRIYMGKTTSGDITLVLVGVNDSDADMTSGVLLDELITCPPYCDTNSPLNL